MLINFMTTLEPTKSLCSEGHLVGKVNGKKESMHDVNVSMHRFNVIT